MVPYRGCQRLQFAVVHPMNDRQRPYAVRKAITCAAETGSVQSETFRSIPNLLDQVLDLDLPKILAVDLIYLLCPRPRSYLLDLRPRSSRGLGRFLAHAVIPSIQSAQRCKAARISGSCFARWYTPATP